MIDLIAFISLLVATALILLVAWKARRSLSNESLLVVVGASVVAFGVIMGITRMSGSTPIALLEYCVGLIGVSFGWIVLWRILVGDDPSKNSKD